MSEDSLKLLSDLVLQVQRLSLEVSSLRDLLQSKGETANGWTDAKTAAEVLKSEGIKNRWNLRDLRLAGELGNGVRNISTGTRPTWQYHIPTCRKLLQKYYKKIG